MTDWSLAIIKLSSVHLNGPMTSTRLLTILFCTTLLNVSLCASANAENPPNILFIGVDDLRPELNCYGASQMQSPNIDRLAADGIRFDRAYCQQAVCLPSRISLFTGLRPNSTGVHDLQTKFRDTIPDVVTLPQILGKAGYYTIGMGKVYHDEQPKEWSEWIDVKDAKNVKTYHLESTRVVLDEREAEAKSKGLKGKAKRHFLKGPSVEAADRPDAEYEDGAMTQIAIEKIKSSKAHGGKPFFMTVGFRKPHLPLIAPKKYWDLYNRSDIKLPENYFLPKDAPKLALSTWGELRAYSDIPQSGPLSGDKAIDLIHGYYASVSFVDAQIGLLLDAIKAEGLDENTLVVLWSDHGWKLGEHAMWCKHTNFEIDARVPLIIRTPASANSNQTSDAMVELVDLYPTLCEFAGTSIPEQCEGKSLVPLLRQQKDVQWREHAMSQFKRTRKKGGDIVGYSIRLPKGRYTEWINSQTGKIRASEYYNHENDPDENHNVYAELSKDESTALSKRLRETIKNPLGQDFQK